MTNFKVLNTRDLKIFFENVMNSATGKIIPMEWQWLPEEFAVRVRLDGENWILINDDGYECTDKAMAHHLACWYVRDLSQQKAMEVLNVPREEF